MFDVYKKQHPSEAEAHLQDMVRRIRNGNVDLVHDATVHAQKHQLPTREIHDAAVHAEEMNEEFKRIHTSRRFT